MECKGAVRVRNLPKALYSMISVSPSELKMQTIKIKKTTDLFIIQYVTRFWRRERVAYKKLSGKKPRWYFTNRRGCSFNFFKKQQPRTNPSSRHISLQSDVTVKLDEIVLVKISRKTFYHLFIYFCGLVGITRADCFWLFLFHLSPVNKNIQKSSLKF